MKRILAITLLSSLGWSAYSDSNDWRFQEQKQKEEVKSKEDRSPSSTPIGGARSGDLYFEQDQDAQLKHDAEKQKMLYEHEGKYRKGL